MRVKPSWAPVVGTALAITAAGSLLVFSTVVQRTALDAGISTKVNPLAPGGGSAAVVNIPATGPDSEQGSNGGEDLSAPLDTLLAQADTDATPAPPSVTSPSDDAGEQPESPTPSDDDGGPVQPTIEDRNPGSPTFGGPQQGPLPPHGQPGSGGPAAGPAHPSAPGHGVPADGGPGKGPKSDKEDEDKHLDDDGDGHYDEDEAEQDGHYDGDEDDQDSKHDSKHSSGKGNGHDKAKGNGHDKAKGNGHDKAKGNGHSE
ncbi:MAG: hypothetical protein ACRDKZ_01495, partial [Actinomycetota bacterium]